MAPHDSVLPARYEAVIKVNLNDSQESRALDIEEGIGYAVALLMDEYDRAADEIADLLGRATRHAYDEEARRTSNA